MIVGRIPVDVKLHTLVSEAGGMVEVKMGALRDARCAGRLGCQVLSDIAAWLEQEGFGWIPDRLPNDQDHIVTVYDRQSRAGLQLELARFLASSERERRRAAEAS